MVAGEMEKQNLPYTSTQCHDKWRYLKSQYAAKKDNMSDRQFGSDRMDFKYFELMDEFLGKKHNIRPIAVASSVQGDTLTTEDEANSSETDSSIQPSGKKKKVTSVGVTRRKNTFEELVDKIETAGTLREENRERRHQETLQTRNNAVEVFASKMDALLKKT
ncbi:unnamed protein product [Tenebrio molitor]|nr:unnamed protein product [Tenebrio molitor]